MFKKFTMAAVVAALAVVMMPAASQAGGSRGEARASCGVTKMFQRGVRHTDRAMRRAARSERRHHRHHRRSHWR